MNNEKNTMATQPLQWVPGFDPLSFARETVNQAGKKLLTLDLAHKKVWFRRACPSGGAVLTPLRVTDTMAIFEARVFADKDDRNPLASFTATKAADKAAGRQYIRAAQDEALNEALENAGFSLRTYQPDGMQKPANTGEPVEAPKTADGPKQAVQQAAPKASEPPKQTDQTETADVPKQTAAPRPAPVGPQPRSRAQAAPAAEAPKPAPEPAQTAPAPAEAGAPKLQAVIPIESAVPEAAESAPPAFTADMDVEKICPLMTLDYARGILAPSGIRKGWTLGQVADDTPSSLKWYRHVCPDADNITKAACQLLLDNLEQKETLKQAG